jgi:hypothetical protein
VLAGSADGLRMNVSSGEMSGDVISPEESLDVNANTMA